eukprot:TRINITY_DN15985_c0_g1_i1.p1 TRINITY_DN15985_c0_g1~~TRINITY_DN15985_c0_g1_i1.p1  ORF type:complete len:117 (+),score=22.15 TRINITY_DN15985_c0_g1_i1:116-466(+)
MFILGLTFLCAVTIVSPSPLPSPEPHLAAPIVISLTPLGASVATAALLAAPAVLLGKAVAGAGAAIAVGSSIGGTEKPARQRPTQRVRQAGRQRWVKKTVTLTLEKGVYRVMMNCL